MASILRSMAGKIGRLLGKPKAPKVKERLFQYTDPNAPAGHRGIAAGNLTARQEAAEAFYQGEGPQPWTAEETSKWKPLSAGVVAGFLYEQQIIFLHSSNVVAAQYFLDSQKLMVEFKGKGRPNSAYLYSNMSEQEALDLVNGQSKGGWVWDRLRVRGSKTAHRKPFVRIR